ncbi:MAG: aldehyde dehydrogenase family protein [Chloroflexi bacterium]|nr:aldehyde dehydrogenase family protein [Chloroflexota bacterium]
MRNVQLFIDGKFCDGVSGKTFPSINPATGEQIARIAAGDSQDVDLAVKAARRAYEDVWSKINPVERRKILNRLADLIEENQDELAYLDSIDGGKPLLDCKEDVPGIAGIIRFYAGLADKICGATLPVQQDMLAFTQREPYGVVGIIIPWNNPLFSACGRSAPVLAMGNTCVLKPAEQTSLSALEFARLAQKAGIPDGVLNVVTGFGETAGAAIASHMDIDKISFTGSTDVGRLIMEAAAKSNLKPVTLELGGKSPNIIFADANLEAALDSAVVTVFYNQGQTCNAATRLLVDEKIYDKVIEGLLERVKRIVVGDPLSEKTHMGSLVSKEQYERVLSYIEGAIQQGAHLLCGGKPPKNDHLANGYFMWPTIFTDVTPEMRVYREEVFGPVLSVIKFSTEEEAVELANNVAYGLAASVWTKDSARLLRMAKRIQSGTVWANCVGKENPVAPVGGYKQSGFGKEKGIEAGLEYTRLKTVWVDLTDSAFRWV